MADSREAFFTWANFALQHYKLHEPSLRFIRHSENITFQVTDNHLRQQFLLRLHRPLSTFFVGTHQNPIAIESELLWLEALDRDTDLTVQCPVRNKDGYLVTAMQLPNGGGELACSVLEWLDSEHFYGNSPQAPTRTVQLGSLSAHLHNHASTWEMPKPFIRPSYSADYDYQVLNALLPGVTEGTVSVQDYDTLQETGEMISRLLSNLDHDPQHWGLIHNDLHPGNCLVHNHQVCPIDFSLCGIGYFLSDIAISVSSLNTDLRRYFFEGYIHFRSLPQDYVRLVEAFFIVSRLSYYAFILPEPSQRDWLKVRLPIVVEATCRRFLRNEPFLFQVR